MTISTPSHVSISPLVIRFFEGSERRMGGKKGPLYSIGPPGKSTLNSKVRIKKVCYYRATRDDCERYSSIGPTLK